MSSFCTLARKNDELPFTDMLLCSWPSSGVQD